ncbi:MAG: hypothetical protein F4Y27_09230 [Acidimicrobiaceae bacterium]|nr:hypothetical protein [Acidimicrobiaceae bacterium]MYA74846.1 hypothetical protein [Acidimicrobiaceae bacterium]MYG56635.1 hypothetical protein [Acidimicrobiaceae bacterium]MYJ97634.1 hypothetical protein [Acidimicrobiaceae bacterium]
MALIGSVARGDDTDDSDCDFFVSFVKGVSLLVWRGFNKTLQACFNAMPMWRHGHTD